MHFPTIYFCANKVGFLRSGHNYTFLCWHDFKKNGLVYGRHLHAAILNKYKAITARSLVLLQKMRYSNRAVSTFDKTVNYSNKAVTKKVSYKVN